MNTQAMHDKVILIIGGTSGLGLSAAKCLISAGVGVIVTGRSLEKVDCAIAALVERSRA